LLSSFQLGRQTLPAPTQFEASLPAAAPVSREPSDKLAPVIRQRAAKYGLSGREQERSWGGVETGRRLNTFATAARSLSRPSIPKPAQFNNSYSGQRCLRASGLRSAPRAAAEQTLSPTSGRSSGPPTGRRTLAQVHKAAAFRGAEAEAEGGGAGAGAGNNPRASKFKRALFLGARASQRIGPAERGRARGVARAGGQSAQSPQWPSGARCAIGRTGPPIGTKLASNAAAKSNSNSNSNSKPTSSSRVHSTRSNPSASSRPLNSSFTAQHYRALAGASEAMRAKPASRTQTLEPV